MSISDALKSAHQTVHNAVHHVAKKAGQVVDNVKDTVSDVKDKVGEVKDKVVNDAVELSGKAKDLIDKTVEKGHAWEDRKFGDEADLNKAMDEAGVDDEHVINIMGTNEADNIDVTVAADGSYKVTVNGDTQEYSAEEAQRLNIYARGGDDTITIHGEDGAKITDGTENAAIFVNGGDGDDTINAENVPNGISAPSLYLTGGRGDDTIKGGNGDDTIIDNYGSNNIDGSFGNDKITALGRDSEQGLFGLVASLFNGRRGTESNVIESGVGNDTVITGDGDDIITNLRGDDKIYTNGGDDTITLSNQIIDDCVVYAGDGNDTIYGGAGRDFIDGGAGDDKIYGKGGGDVIYGGLGDDYIEGGDGDDFINAGAGNDEVHGGWGNDTIFGLSGDDMLYGEEGRDTLVAGKGTDKLDGGVGADTLRYTDSDKNGHDLVLNADDADDAKVLEPIKVPRNFITNPLATQSFKAIIDDNLEAFAAIEPGQRLLEGIGRTGHAVFFEQMDEMNGYATPLNSQGDAKIIENDDGTRSYKARIGCPTKIQINPYYIDVDDSTMLVMAHEMCHAYNNATGTMDRAFYYNDTGELADLPAGTSKNEAFAQRALYGAELQAVGIYDDSTIAPNPYGISENDYRQFFHMDPRTSYLSQSEDQFRNSNHGGIDIDEWARLYQ